ncbi:MAG: hypothetical protein AAFV43_13685 [Planctomycetota bacterium]
MDCEKAFAALTRGPLVGLDADDQAVISHLEECESCRQLAEALRPAPDAFHESLPAGEEAQLPAFRVRDDAVLAPLGTAAEGPLPSGRTLPARIYRRAVAPPARRTWTASRESQARSRRAQIEEAPDAFERALALTLLVTSASASVGVIGWAAVRLVGWLAG